MGISTKQIDAAREWVRTDPDSIDKDIARLGIKRAATYNRELVLEGVASGDTRFRPATVAALAYVFGQRTSERKLTGGKRRSAKPSAHNPRRGASVTPRAAERRAKADRIRKLGRGL